LAVSSNFEAAADQAIAACGRDGEVVKALIVANDTEPEKLRASVSTGYAQGRLLPRDRNGLV
jgi:hypothetical protein